jgi:hypothetical protein
VRRPGAAGILCAAILWPSGRASANGRYPASTQIVFSTSGASAGPSLLVVRATYGLLLSRDGGGSWRWLCEGALGVPAVSIQDPSIALTASGALVVGLDRGLEVSADQGCHFDCAGGSLAGSSIVDLAVRPDAPHTVLALSSTYVFGEDAAVGDGGGPSLDTRVFQSTDDGAHWTQLGRPLDGTVVVTTLDVARSDPETLYVSGTRGFGMDRSASLFVSNNGGANWTERPLPFDPVREVAIFIGAVDPDLPDRVYVRSSGQSRLFVTSDGGRSFETPLALHGQMLGLAIAPDGSRVYAGSVEDGLYVGATASGAGDASLAFHKTSSIHVQCLATHGQELWACSDEPSGFLVGASMDDGAHFSPRLQPDGITGSIACAADTTGPFACGADANASQCSGAAFDAVCSSLGGCGADASSSGASEGDATPAPTLDAGSRSEPMAALSGGGGCSTSARGGAAGFAASCAILAVATRRRRQRRRRKTRP